MARMATLVRRETDHAFKNKKYTTELESKELLDSVEPYNHGSKSPPRRSESGN